ncbi:MAG: (d)CMP kinase [Acidobacteria bacterium]|nr:(d)CMP kinase [Acidobacteriota bacterium]MBI3662270.1 (d)CMP kinase [Acidobacteriota bacterium]
MRKLIVAIDGPVGSGKSTVARRVAELLGYTYLDSGAMYRAVALKAMRRGIPLDDAMRMDQLAKETRIDLVPTNSESSGAKAPGQESNAYAGAEAQTPYGTRVLLDGADVTAEIRTPGASQSASKIAVLAGVRRHLVAEQRRAGAAGGVVMEGRDIGTVVFPDADLKIYLDASVEVRAQRRLQEHMARGETISLEKMMEEVRQRDQRDKEREASPLVRAADALLVDNTAMDVEETARLIVMLAGEKQGSGASG